MEYDKAMKSMKVLIVLVFLCSLAVAALPAISSPKAMESRPSAYGGKLFAGPEDPGYKEYDLSLRTYLANRIHKRYGIKLDTKIYSGFDLLEIEAFLRMKKSNEPLEPFLKMFPKSR